MNIEEKRFYFIKDEFMNKYGIYLMKNKKNTKRPCYFCFADENDKEILWFVPVSTKAEKYLDIYHNKKRKYRKVYNFVFGHLHGKKAVFLVQNIFPITERYIIEKYITENKDVRISKNLSDKIIKNSRYIINMALKGHSIAFYNIIEMKQKLLSENKELEKI